MKLSNSAKGVVYPLLAAMIWGVSFPAQAICGQYMEPLYINGIRSIIAAAALAVVLGKIKKKKHLSSFGDRKCIIAGSLLCGIFLFLAVNAQQVGISYGTDSGKAGFITAMYVVFVPITNACRGKGIKPRVIVAVAVSVVGLFLLCVQNDFSVGFSDIIVLCSAVFFAFQMVALDKYSKKVNSLALSCGQFFVTGLLSLFFAAIAENGDAQRIGDCLPWLLYMALISCAIGYTLQVKSYELDANPTVLAILFSLESVFAVIAGVLICGESLTLREIIGCVVMFIAVMLAVVPSKRRREHWKIKQLHKLRRRG